MNENKQEIVSRLKLLLKVTRIGRKVDRLILSGDEERITIFFKDGTQHEVDIECDSGYAIIKDVMKCL